MEITKRLPMNNYNAWPVLLSTLFNRDSFNEGNLDFFDKNKNVSPAVNIQENAEGFMIELLAPGFSKTDFKIEINQKTLTIRAEKQNTDENSTANYTRREFSFESISRSFTLPENIVDPDKVNAQYIDGVLKLEIPKREEVLPKTKLIEIK